MLPLPGVLTRRISSPNSCDNSRLMARPRPVPPYFRLVLPSACWKALKMMRCLSGGMPKVWELFFPCQAVRSAPHQKLGGFSDRF